MRVMVGGATNIVVGQNHMLITYIQTNGGVKRPDSAYPNLARLIYFRPISTLSQPI